MGDGHAGVSFLSAGGQVNGILLPDGSGGLRITGILQDENIVWRPKEVATRAVLSSMVSWGAGIVSDRVFISKPNLSPSKTKPSNSGWRRSSWMSPKRRCSPWNRSTAPPSYSPSTSTSPSRTCEPPPAWKRTGRGWT